MAEADPNPHFERMIEATSGVGTRFNRAAGVSCALRSLAGLVLRYDKLNRMAVVQKIGLVQ